MSLFGSLFTGVSALTAQGQNMAIISNNIANVNTTGFKRAEGSFFSQVTTEGRLSRYSPGTVSITRQQRVNQQGPIQQTSSSTDVAVSGNGMIPVKRSTDAGQEFLYTRNGSFSEDSEGLLRNTAGFVLYAWPIDANGNLPASQGDLGSLVPADVAFLGGLTRPTTSAEISINLDATEDPYNSHTFTTPGLLPVGVNSPAHFSRGVRVFDSLGSPQDLTLQFRKIVGPMAHATTQTSSLTLNTSLTDAAIFTGMAAGDQFSITVGASSQTYTIVSPSTGVTGQVATVGELIQQVNTLFGGGGVLQARLDGSGRLLFQTVDPTEDLVFANATNTPLSGAGTLNLYTDPSGDGSPLSFHPEAELQAPFTVYPDQTDFPDFANITNPNTQGWWEMIVQHPDGTVLSQGLLNFDGDGSLNASPDSSGNVDLNLSGINWGNGSDLQNIDVDIERFSQFSGNYDVIASDQNGAALGLRTGVEITREGIVVARFSNGASADLYKIPLVTFANVNGLQEVSGTAYVETDGSGEENLREAGNGGAGFLEISTIEVSNVDIADEFAKMIVTQRAFSAGTKVISTADEMTDELLRLR